MDNLEQEIAELQRKIEEKRNLLEQQGGIIEEKEFVRESVKEILPQAQAQTEQTPETVRPAVKVEAPTGEVSYLDHLDEESLGIVNSLIEELPTLGLAKVVTKAESYNIPYLVDALHDALVDKLYEELKSRGFVK